MPPHAYLDASALSKRYAREAGTDEVNYLFARVPPDRRFVLTVGLVEVASVLVRKCNRGLLAAAERDQGLSDLNAEVVADPALRKLPVDFAALPAAMALVVRHSVNATDAFVLHTALDVAAVLRPAGDDLIVVAADKRLCAAARAEGLVAYDPEAQPAADLDALLGP